MTAISIELISWLFDMALACDRSHTLQGLNCETGALNPTGAFGELEWQVRGSRLGRKIEAQITPYEPLAPRGILQLHRP